MKKNNILTRLVVFLTVLALVAGTFVGVDLIKSNESASAASATVDSISWNYTVDGSNATLVYTTQILTGDVTIPATINGYTVTSLGGGTNETKCIPAGSTVTSVNIPKTITNINDYAFKDQTGLKATNYYEPSTNEPVSIENTTLTSIGNYAFQNNTSLKYVCVPKNTSVGSYAYAQNTGITSIDLLGSNTVGSYAFNGCTAINQLFIASTITLGDYAFKECTGLKNLEVGIATVGNQFDNCPALENIVLDETVTKVENFAFNVTNTKPIDVNTNATLIKYLEDGTKEANRGKSGLTSNKTRTFYIKNPDTLFGFENETRYLLGSFSPKYTSQEHHNLYYTSTVEWNVSLSYTSIEGWAYPYWYSNSTNSYYYFYELTERVAPEGICVKKYVPYEGASVQFKYAKIPSTMGITRNNKLYHNSQSALFNKIETSTPFEKTGSETMTLNQRLKIGEEPFFLETGITPAGAWDFTFFNPNVTQSVYITANYFSGTSMSESEIHELKKRYIINKANTDVKMYPNTVSGQIANVNLYIPKGSKVTTTNQVSVTNKDNSLSYVTAENMVNGLSTTNYANFVNDYVKLYKTIEKEDFPCYQADPDRELTGISATYDGVAFEGNEINYDALKIKLRHNPAKATPDVISASDPHVYVISKTDLDKFKNFADGKNAYESWTDKGSAFPESAYNYSNFDYNVWEAFTHVLDDDAPTSNVNVITGMNSVFSDKIPEGYTTSNTKVYVFYVAGFKDIGKGGKYIKESNGTISSIMDYNDDHGTDYKEGPFAESGTYTSLGGSYSDAEGTNYDLRDGVYAPIIYKCEVDVQTVPATPNIVYHAKLNTDYLDANAESCGWNVTKQAFAISDSSPITITKDMIIAQSLSDGETKTLAKNKFDLNRTEINSMDDNVVTVTFKDEETAYSNIAIPCYNTDLNDMLIDFNVSNLSDLKKDVEQLSSDYSKATDNLDTYSKIVSGIEKQLKEEELTEEERTALESTLAISNTKIASIKEEISTLQTNLETKKTELNTASKKIEELNKTVESNEEKISNLQETIEKNKDTIKQLQETNGGLVETVEIKSQTILELQTSNKTLTDTITELTGDITDMEDTIGSLRESVTTMENSINTLETNNAELDTQVSNLKGNITELNTTIENLENDVITKDQAITELNTTVEKMDASIKNLEKIKADNEKEITDLTAENSSQKALITTLEAKIDSAKKEMDKLESANNEIKDTITEIVKEMGGSTSVSATDLPSLVGKLQEEIKNLQEKSDPGISSTTEEALTSLGIEKGTSSDETVKALIDTIKSKNQEISSLKSNTGSIKTEYVYVKSNTSSTTPITEEKAFKDLEEKNDTLTTENKALTAKVSGLTTEVTNLSNNNKSLESENLSLEKTVDDQNSQIAALSAQLKTMKGSESAKDSQISALKGEVKELNGSIAEIKASKTTEIATPITQTPQNPIKQVSVSTSENKPLQNESNDSNKESVSEEKSESVKEQVEATPIVDTTLNKTTIASVPTPTEYKDVFSSSVAWAKTVTYNMPAVKELTEGEKKSMNNIFSYYSENSRLLTSLIPDTEFTQILNGKGIKADFEPVTGAMVETEEDTENGVNVVLQGNQIENDCYYLIVHESPVRNCYDVLTVKAVDNTIGFTLEDLSPIAVSKIVASQNVEAAAPTTEDVTETVPETVEEEETTSASSTGYLIICVVIAIVFIGVIVFAIMKLMGKGKKKNLIDKDTSCDDNNEENNYDEDDDV